MATILERQITDDEKKLILERFGRICYATGHQISNDEEVEFDHIKSFADKGASEIDNIAPMCRNHNLKKGRLPLYDFNIKLKMEEFFELGHDLTLKNELEYFKKNKEIEVYGDNVYLEVNDSEVQIEINDRKKKFQLYKCPTTSWEYFYATLPATVLNSDDDEEQEVGLQPRYLIQDKVFNLFRHFQKNPVLQPSLARYHKNKILVFDGQHKIAAMMWGGRREFEIKVYINSDPKLLNTTNIAAHDKFAQTRFYSSIMVAKLGSQFGKQFEEYKNLEDGSKKTEQGFVNFLQIDERLTTGDVNKRFTSFLYNAVLEPTFNKVARLVSKSNRRTDEFPLTMDMLSKSLLSNFLYRYPIDDDLALEHYKRDKEIENLIRLFNTIDSEALHNWDQTKSIFKKSEK